MMYGTTNFTPSRTSTAPVAPYGVVPGITRYHQGCTLPIVAFGVAASTWIHPHSPQRAQFIAATHPLPSPPQLDMFPNPSTGALHERSPLRAHEEQMLTSLQEERIFRDAFQQEMGRLLAASSASQVYPTLHPRRVSLEQNKFQRSQMIDTAVAQYLSGPSRVPVSPVSVPSARPPPPVRVPLHHPMHQQGTVPPGPPSLSHREVKRQGSRKIERFPVKLHQMLNAMESMGTQDIISFSPSGRNFQIHKQDLFVRDVAPKFFRHTCISSFKRQLKLYAFNQVTSGPDKGAYYRANFHRDKPERCENMKPSPREDFRTKNNLILKTPLDFILDAKVRKYHG